MSVTQYTFKNLITASSATLTNVTRDEYEFTYQPDGLSMVEENLISPIANHKYYGRCYQKAPAGYTWADARFEYYATDADQSLMVFGFMEATDNQWKILSGIQSLSAPISATWKLRSFTVNGSSVAYRKDHIIVDLTETFGAGNEPNKEWCDKNIPFFEGSVTLTFGAALGDTFLDNFALGDTFLDAIYLGEDLIWQKTINYNYGDGSLNTVSLGYEGVLLLNGAPVDHSNGSYYSGNFRVYGADTQSNSNTLRPLLEALRTSSVSRTYITSGTVTYTLSVDASEQDMTLWLCVFGSGMTTSAYIGSLKFNVDGAFYTLSEMVANGFIKPLVIMASSASNGKYYWNNLFNLYTGGKTASGNYAALDLVFMLNKGHKITQFQLYANKKFNTTYDGWQASMAPTRDCRLTIE